MPFPPMEGECLNGAVSSLMGCEPRSGLSARVLERPMAEGLGERRPSGNATVLFDGALRTLQSFLPCDGFSV